MKLTDLSLSSDLQSQDRAARAMAVVGEALVKASAILQGKVTSDYARPAMMASSACNVTINELANEFLLVKSRSQRSDRYLRQLRLSLTAFMKGRARMAIDQVRAGDLESWIHGQNWASKTVRNYVSDVGGMFNFAVRRGYVQRNPALGVELPPADSSGKIHIHTPDQVRAVLTSARRGNLDVCRRLAVRYFCGVRSAEANRLTEADIKLDQGWLEVPALKSKTRARRLVKIQPNLAAWLKLGGELRPMTDFTIRKVVALSGVAWQHNVTRHSFVSYHLAHFQKANETALEAGHSEAMLFKHYRALVTPAQAAEFWAIRP